MNFPAPARAHVAVIIVNYLSYPELHACLASLGQASGDISVTVVDHASDATQADALRRAFPRVQLLPVRDNEGFAAGVNRGARATSAEYLLLLNPDCLLEEDVCATLARWMDAHPRVGVAAPLIRNADGTIQPSARRFPNITTGIAGRSSWLTRAFPRNPLSRHNLEPSLRASAEPRDVEWVSGACMMIRRTAFDAVGGMDEGFFLYWEDADLCRRMNRAGWRTVYCPFVQATHVGGRSSRHAADASLVAFHRSAYRLFWKHSSVAGRVLAPLVFIGLQARLAIVRRMVRARER